MLPHVVLHDFGRPPLVLGESRPVVIILQGSAYVHHVVDPAGAAEKLATGYVMDSTTVSLLRRRVHAPVVLGVLEHAKEGRRRVNKRISNATLACFDNPDGDVGVFAQAGSNRTACGAAAADDVVEFGAGELVDRARAGLHGAERSRQ